MSFMLPAPAAHSRSLTGVAPELLRALRGESEWAAASSAVLCVIDGLGAIALRAHAGHARHLTSLARKKDVAHSVYPSTTASALTSLLTGVTAGQHGLVGYSVRVPGQTRVRKQLSEWGACGFDPDTWQRHPTVFEQAATLSFGAYAIGPSVFVGTGFSQAVLRGAEYLAVDSVRERFERAVDLAATQPGSLVYCYFPEVDKAGHKYGVDSAQWIAALEEIGAVFAQPIAGSVGVIITADHGMIDVPRHRHVLLGHDDPRFVGVAALGGEPRFMYVYLEPGEDRVAAAQRWQTASGTTADVLTREQAIAAGIFGQVHAEVEPRIGDLVVVTRGLWAFYDDTLADKRSQGMVGQHGSLTPEETMVPLLRAGAFAH